MKISILLLCLTITLTSSWVKAQEDDEVEIPIEDPSTSDGPDTVTGPNDDSYLLLCRNMNFDQCIQNKDAKIKFLFHTKYNPKPYELVTDDAENLRRSNFISGKRVKLIIHGFTGQNPEYPKATKDAYMNVLEDLNVIIVDWSDGASMANGYTKAASCTKAVARRVGKLLKFLIKQGLTSLDKVHVIGHSLGAQVGGMIGREMGQQLARITGLDPAHPCFDKSSAGHALRLQPNDAIFVDVIHSDAQDKGKDGLGLIEQLGHVDFFPNSGSRDQPGCHAGSNKLDFCSHLRAPQLFTESILKPAALVGRQCEGWSKFLNGECNDRSTRVMGEHTPVTSSREASPFYLTTGGLKPYGLGSKGSRS